MDLLFGWRGRVRRWPRLEFDRPPWGMCARPGDIKVASTDVLERLMRKARDTPGVSATGRPEWLETHRSDLDDHYIVTVGAAGRGFSRCVVVCGLNDDPGGSYTLDID